MGSSCVSVGRAVVSDTADSWFGSSHHWNIAMKFFSLTAEKAKIKKRETRNGPFKKSIPWVSRCLLLQNFEHLALLDLPTVVTRWVWLDWAIYCTLGDFSKPVTKIILPKLPINFAKVSKIFQYSSDIILGQLLLTFGDFLMVTLNKTDPKQTKRSWFCKVQFIFGPEMN